MNYLLLTNQPWEGSSHVRVTLSTCSTNQLIGRMGQVGRGVFHIRVPVELPDNLSLDGLSRANALCLSPSLPLGGKEGDQRTVE